MILLKKFTADYKGNHIVVDFGRANTQQEEDEIYRLRYQVYKEHKYIEPSHYPDGMESDTYDKSGKCTYFIAKYNDKIIGSIRLIKDNILPTEYDYDFQEPETIKKIPRDNRAELGRFIIIPPNKDKKIFMPRGVCMLILLNVLSEHGIKNNLQGGYCFIKSALEKKLRSRKSPFHKIEPHKLKIDENNTLYNYFTSESDPAIPIYYLTKEFFDYTEEILNNKLMFKNQGDVIILKNNLYTKFLTLFGLI